MFIYIVWDLPCGFVPSLIVMETYQGHICIYIVWDEHV